MTAITRNFTYEKLNNVMDFERVKLTDAQYGVIVNDFVDMCADEEHVNHSLTASWQEYTQNICGSPARWDNFASYADALIAGAERRARKGY